jgi:hypothetical protein
MKSILAIVILIIGLMIGNTVINSVKNVIETREKALGEVYEIMK